MLTINLYINLVIKRKIGIMPSFKIKYNELSENKESFLNYMKNLDVSNYNLFKDMDELYYFLKLNTIDNLYYKSFSDNSKWFIESYVKYQEDIKIFNRQINNILDHMIMANTRDDKFLKLKNSLDLKYQNFIKNLKKDKNNNNLIYYINLYYNDFYDFKNRYKKFDKLKNNLKYYIKSWDSFLDLNKMYNEEYKKIKLKILLSNKINIKDNIMELNKWNKDAYKQLYKFYFYENLEKIIYWTILNSITFIFCILYIFNNYKNKIKKKICKDK